MTDGDYGSDPTGGELADVARSGAREWQLEMAAWETDAEVLRLRRRTMVNVLWESMQRGDRVTLTLGEHSFTGTLAAALADFALLTTPELDVAVNLGNLGAIHIERASGGVVGDRTFGSLRAFLGMLEVDGREVRVLGREIDVQGRVQVVADDHLLLQTTDGESAVALAALAAVVVNRD